MSDKPLRNDSACATSDAEGSAAKASELELIVAEMRKLGVKEYRDKDGLAIVLGDAPQAPPDEKSEEEQQRIRDEREKQRLEYKRRILTAAATRIGPAVQKIK